MDVQQATASRMAAANNERLAAREALREHMAGNGGDRPQKNPEAERTHKPTEREMIEARQGLAVEHAAAIGTKRDGIDR